MTIRAELDLLAKDTIKKARESATALDSMVEALKVCATYYAICEKVKAKSGDESPGDTFDSFTRAIHGASHHPETPNGSKIAPTGGRRAS